MTDQDEALREQIAGAIGVAVPTASGFYQALTRDDLLRATDAVLDTLEPLLTAERERAGHDAEHIAMVEGQNEALRQDVDEAREVIHADLCAILTALDLGTHARPYSSHDVVHREVLPAIREAREHLDQLARSVEGVEALCDRGMSRWTQARGERAVIYVPVEAVRAALSAAREGGHRVSVSVTDVTSTEYLVVDRNRVPLLTPFGEAERGLASAEAAAINKFRTKQFGWDPEADKVHVEVRITHTRVEQYEVKE